MAGVVCEQCKISNPVDRKTCMNCGATLVAPKTAVAEKSASKPQPVPSQPTSTVARPEGTPKVYYPTTQDDIIPGRPPWVSAYALLLGGSSAIVITGLVMRLLSGSLGDIYGSYVVVAGIIVICLGAITTSLELWRLHERGRKLTMGVQIIWMIATAFILVLIYNELPTTSDQKGFLDGAGLGLVLLFVPGVLVIGLAQIFIPVLRPSGSRRARRQVNPWLSLAGYLIVASVGMFIAMITFFVEPALISLAYSYTWIWLFSIFVRACLILSIPINALILFGLVYERQRFT